MSCPFEIYRLVFLEKHGEGFSTILGYYKQLLLVDCFVKGVVFFKLANVICYSAKSHYLNWYLLFQLIWRHNQLQL